MEPRTGEAVDDASKTIGRDVEVIDFRNRAAGLLLLFACLSYGQDTEDVVLHFDPDRGFYTGKFRSDALHHASRFDDPVHPGRNRSGHVVRRFFRDIARGGPRGSIEYAGTGPGARFLRACRGRAGGYSRDTGQDPYLSVRRSGGGTCPRRRSAGPPLARPEQRQRAGHQLRNGSGSLQQRFVPR